MAPEQIEGKEADARRDIFAFGCVLYETADGQARVRGQVSRDHRRGHPRQGAGAAEHGSAARAGAAGKNRAHVSSKDPEARFQKARDVKLALEWVRQ